MNSRIRPTDDHWQSVESEIVLADHIPAEALDGIEGFSHLEIIFFFDQVVDEPIVFSGHPRGDISFPSVGIFSQRKKDRPNHIGLTTVELVQRSGRTITVRRLDAIHGTPVLDIKPVFREFAPKEPVRQPDWVQDLMKHYW